MYSGMGALPWAKALLLTAAILKVSSICFKLTYIRVVLMPSSEIGGLYGTFCSVVHIGLYLLVCAGRSCSEWKLQWWRQQWYSLRFRIPIKDF